MKSSKKGSSSNGTSDVVRQNLLDAKAKLTSQESELVLQLDQIRKSIESIETTIQVVGLEATSKPKTTRKASTTRKPRTPRATKTATAAPKTATKAPRATRGTKTPAKTAAKTAAPAVKTKTTAVKSKSPVTSKPPATSTPSRRGRKPGKDDAGWQNYLVDEFKGKPLTEVVEIVFTRSPQSLMGSNELINTIFTSDIPKKERTAARDRLLNILSIGVNEKKWYRAKPGKYTLTKATGAKA